MSIDKKECRKHADPGLVFNPGHGLLILERIEYVVRAVVRNIDNHRVLTVYFFSRVKVAEAHPSPEYILYQRRDDFITLDQGGERGSKWRGASLERLGARYPRFTNGCAFYSRNDERLVTSFCAIEGQMGFEALESLQSKIMDKRRRARVIARERKTIKRMERIPTIPRSFSGWIHREALRHYIFYKYENRREAAKGYCTACRHDVRAPGARHNSEGICPSCGKAITYKAEGISKSVWDRETVQVLQKANDQELILRIFKIYNGLNEWKKPVLNLWESARFFVRRNEKGEMAIDRYYYSHNKGLLTKWQKGARPRMSYYQYNFECDLCGRLYLENLEKTLKDTPWQYCQIESFCRAGYKALEVLPYLSVYNRYPALEYLVKQGLISLTEEVVYRRGGSGETINLNGASLKEALGVGREDLVILKSINADIRQLELCQRARSAGVYPDENLLVWYKRHGVSLIEDILIPLSYMTPMKLIRYIDEQYDRHIDDIEKTVKPGRYDRINRVLSDYKDYLIMGVKLGYNFKDCNSLFPSNLSEAHDTASVLYKNHKDEIQSELIRGAYNELKTLYYLNKDGLILTPPKTTDEIVNEGRFLRHCVHTYVEKVASGSCVILFIRKADKLGEPYYTLELRDKRVIQVHGMNHALPTPEVKQFIELWEREKLGQIETLRKVA